MSSLQFLQQGHPVLLAFLAGLLTWAVTALGAALVFTGEKFSRRGQDFLLGSAAGIMLAASYWSLLAPAVELSQGLGAWGWFPPVVGFLAGGIVLRVVDAYLPHLHPGLDMGLAEGVSTSWRRSTLLVLAITLHNIPEGLAVGVAFGGTALGLEGTSMEAAVALTVGIALQNFPEGFAVAVPLQAEGMSRARSFWFGQLSAVVEPISAVLGAALVLSIQALLPYALSFAAGAMIFVVVEELIPESQQHGNQDLATSGVILGFALMMALDVGLTH
jgi:zinc transporter, ZIP family